MWNAGESLTPKRPHMGAKRRTPLPLGATWIEEEQAFNFAVYAEHAESVTLLLYSADDLVNPILTFQFDFIRNKSGRIWHCRLPLDQMRVLAVTPTRSRDKSFPSFTASIRDKVLLDPYAKSVFFPPEFDRKLAWRRSQRRKGAAGVLTGHAVEFDWSGVVPPRPESETIIYELHVKGFTKNPNSGVHLCVPAHTPAGGKDPVSEGAWDHRRRTDADISARPSRRRLLGLHAFEFLFSACAVCSNPRQRWAAS